MNSKSVLEVANELNTSETYGLTSQEAIVRLEKNGRNELIGAKKITVFRRFIQQFKDILVIILICAAVVSIIVEPSEWIDSVIIFFVVFLNAVLGVYQESKAEKSLEALKKMSTPISKVIRDGKNITINSSEIVVGDIVVVEAGDYIPADARIVESVNLKVDESALTGESVAVEKSVDETKEIKSIGDMTNMLFSSTYSTYGRGKAIVVSTGMNTEIGKIAKMLSTEEEKLTPLQNKLNQIGKAMGILSIVICLLVFVFQLLNGVEYLDAFKTAVALAVAAIPEGLATVVTIILSIGVSKMAKQNAIVKKLPAVETLGCTSVVCSDKTGTLTQNKMTVVEIYDGSFHNIKEEDYQDSITDYYALCCDAKVEKIDGKEIRVGDPTETALIDMYLKCGISNIDKIERVDEIPFDSDRKLMSVVVRINGKLYVITKGAPDKIFDICNNVNNKDIEANEKMARKALRVIGLGIKEVKDTYSVDKLEGDLTFKGLVGMIDPERPEVKEAVKTAKEAGIKTVMITGDHVITAKAIAMNLGIFDSDSIAITSDELNKMSDEEFLEKIDKISVYARVTPSDKVRIVKAWQEKGKVVSMTGDGVNDSPALKTADIGCAMGITGTDVSKEASAMILVDDNFSTIISAVKEGRNIYANIKKCVKYLLSSNIGEVFTIFVVSIISLLFSKNIGVPLLPIHLLWINLITDSLPAFALGMEKSTSELMKENPRDKKESFFAHNLGIHIAIEGFIIGTLTIIAFFIGNKTSLKVGQTMAFVTLAMLQLFHSFNMKSENSILNKKLFNNKWLWYSFGIGFALQMIVLYVPGINDVFGLDGLSFNNLIISLLLGMSIIVVMEIYKAIRNLIFKKNIKK